MLDNGEALLALVIDMGNGGPIAAAADATVLYEPAEIIFYITAMTKFEPDTHTRMPARPPAHTHARTRTHTRTHTHTHHLHALAVFDIPGDDKVIGL